MMVQVVYNELSAAKNPNNMVLLSAMLQFDAKLGAKVCKKCSFQNGEKAKCSELYLICQED